MERFQWGAGFSLQPGFSPALWTHEFTEDRLKSVRRLKPAPHANAENIFMRSKTQTLGSTRAQPVHLHPG